MPITSSDARRAAEQYREEGYAVLHGFADARTMAALKAETDRIYTEGLKHPFSWRYGNLSFEILPERDFDRRYVLQVYWMSWISELFERFRRSEAYLTVLEPILGRDIRQIAQQIHWKPPGAGLTGFRFHQDLKFRPGRGADLAPALATVNTGLAIDPATAENGCLQVVPGSQKLGYLGLSDEGAGHIMDRQTGKEALQGVGLDPATVVDVELDPGDLALWGLLTVHGSPPNRSNHDRAFAISSYVRADASVRGEWAFKDGRSVPLGDTPVLCKFDGLHDRPDPHYTDSRWYAEG